MNRDTFSSYHPIINFLYFALVMVFTMFFMHPVSLLISFVSALTYAIYLNGKKAVQSVTISPEAVDPDDIEMLEDLIMAALNNAYDEAEEMYEEKMGKFGGAGGLF